MPVHAAQTPVIRAPSSVPKTRQWVTAQLVAWGIRLDDSARDDLALITSELATNAVHHGAGAQVTIALSADPRRQVVLIEVWDGSPALPRPRSVGPGAESGRGIHLVERLAVSHGAEVTERGKKVWAKVRLPEQPPTGHRHLARRGLPARPHWLAVGAARAMALRLAGRPLPPTHPATHHPSNGRSPKS